MTRTPVIKAGAVVAASFMCLLTLTTLTACSSSRPSVSLAVDKLPRDQVLTTGYLELNEDNPGVCFDLDQYVVPGKYTVVLFYSPYDNQSMQLKPRLAQLPEANDGLVVRTVNVNRPDIQNVDWESPIIEDEQLQTLPYIQIYEPSQKLRAHGHPAYEQVMQWFREIGG